MSECVRACACVHVRVRVCMCVCVCVTPEMTLTLWHTQPWCAPALVHLQRLVNSRVIKHALHMHAEIEGVCTPIYDMSHVTCGKVGPPY